LNGPDNAEIKQGIFTQIPKGTELRDIYLKDRTVTADFSKELEMVGGGTEKVKAPFIKLSTL